MFELSVACKYLIPRWRQLSVSIISIVSMIVIALVVWLIVVFFSVKNGLESSWIDKLIALTAPIRITPTERYYSTYYYLIDSISAQSDYSLKTIREKLNAEAADPYNPDVDEELPGNWQHPDRNPDGTIKDLAKMAYLTALGIPEANRAKVSDFEMTAANLRLKMVRPAAKAVQPSEGNAQTEQFIDQAAYVGTYDPDTPTIAKTLIPPTPADFNNILLMQKTHGPSSDEPILIPRSFKAAGVLVGDRGYLSYHSATPSSIQEQRIPVYVKSFYDPGIMPIGGKFILAGHNLTDAIRTSQNHDEALLSNGFNLRFDNLSDAPAIKVALVKAFQREGIDTYWNIETYHEYEFTKDLIQQLQSEKNLFGVISMVIIIVACSNIISMLIILVNDKKVEIGILRSMGASSLSIATIFGLCGMVMGAIGSIFGILAAVLTLNNLDFLVGWLSRIQGHELFNPVFYGETLPNEISWEALSLVVLTTAFISLLAGIIPAIKASLVRPSAILRSE